MPAAPATQPAPAPSASLARIDAGTYGTCVRCGGAIPRDRLVLRPFATTCVPCADRRQRGSNEDGDHTGRRGETVMTDPVTFDRNVVVDPRTTAPRLRPAEPSTPPDRLLRGRTAAQVMERFPVVVDQHTSLFAAWGKLRRTGAQHLVVIDEGLRPTGVLDERDIALEWPPGPLAAQHLPVHRLLRYRTRPRVRSGEDMATVAATMASARVDAVPVVARDGRLLGLVTAHRCVELIAGAPSVPHPS